MGSIVAAVCCQSSAGIGFGHIISRIAQKLATSSSLSSPAAWCRLTPPAGQAGKQSRENSTMCVCFWLAPPFNRVKGKKEGVSAALRCAAAAFMPSAAQKGFVSGFKN